MGANPYPTPYFERIKMESIFDKYKDDLERGDRLNITLSRIYGEMFNQKAGQSTFAMFGKICKVYSKREILLALLDMYDMDNINHSNVYPLIVWFIKKRLDNKLPKEPDNDLNAQAKRLQEEYWKLE